MYYLYSLNTFAVYPVPDRHHSSCLVLNGCVVWMVWTPLETGYSCQACLCVATRWSVKCVFVSHENHVTGSDSWALGGVGGWGHRWGGMRYDIIRLGDEGEMVASRIKSRPEWLFSSMVSPSVHVHKPSCSDGAAWVTVRVYHTNVKPHTVLCK